MTGVAITKAGRGRPSCPHRKAAREVALAKGEARFTVPAGGQGCRKCGGMVIKTRSNTCSHCDTQRKYARDKTPAGRDSQHRAAIKYQNSNPAYTLARDVLKRLTNGSKTGLKVSKVFDLVGYTSEDLKAHIESLFEDGMTWDNHGEWHIDHIKPVAKFKAEGITDLSIINALSNLQPLRAADNLSKGARFD